MDGTRLQNVEKPALVIVQKETFRAQLDTEFTDWSSTAACLRTIFIPLPIRLFHLGGLTAGWRHEISLVRSSLSWLAFLQVSAGDPNPRTRIRGRGERRWRTIVAVTFKTEPVS